MIFTSEKKEEQKTTITPHKPKKPTITTTIETKKSTESDNEDDSKVMFKTKLGRSVYRVLFEAEPRKINELFQPQRMAYIVDLTNEEDVDVPITSIRSKADCPNNESNTSLTTNDIVINKLTQILSYLRHGKRDAKKNKKKGGSTATKFDQDKKHVEAELRFDNVRNWKNIAYIYRILFFIKSNKFTVENLHKIVISFHRKNKI